MTTYVHTWIENALGIIKNPRLKLIGGQDRDLLKHNLSIQGTPLCINGRSFEHGLGTHAKSEISVALPAPARSFHAFVGVDDNSLTLPGSTLCQLEFSIVVGTKTIWTSPVLTQGVEVIEVEIELDGVQHFVLKVRDINEVENQGPIAADWAAARVVLQNGETFSLSHQGRPLPQQPPIFFRYDGQSSSEFLESWAENTESISQDNGTVLHRKTYTDPESGLQCLIEMVQFPDFPAVEWLVRFTNTGDTDTPILEDVQTLDFNWESSNVDILLHRSRGTHAQIDDFQYQSEFLHRRDAFKESQNVVMTPAGGRSSQDWLPFFNIQTGDEGFFSAIGWSGEWKAEFLCEDGSAVHTKIGMERTHLKLQAGEEIRTPRILLLFWEGEVQHSHNLLRRFLLKYHTPQFGGRPAQMPIGSATWGGKKTAAHLQVIESYAEKGLDYDLYWVDAGWYGLGETDCPDVFVGDWAGQAGNWNINRYRHPNGLRPISEAAHQHDLKFLLWFELQRAVAGTKLPTDHPDWFFPSQDNYGTLLLNIGHPEALQWCIELASRYITEEGLDWYRQDFNIDPLPYWRAADAPDREGISEIRNIESLYAFWDELLSRHPQLMIDNCASGGRCLDLETIGRSVSLWRSDYQCYPGASPTGAQVQLVGLSHWLPLHAGGTFLNSIGDTYAFRSAISAGMADQLTMYESQTPQDDESWAWASQMLAEQKRLRPYFYGDFYALTECTASLEAWCVYQLHQYQQDVGFVMAFRREKSPFDRGVFALQGLDAETTYILEDADTGAIWNALGSELTTNGLELMIGCRRSSKLIYISQR